MMGSESEAQVDAAPQCCIVKKSPGLFYGAAGLVIGVVLTGLAVLTLMPGMMITRAQSRLGFDETIAALQAGIEEQGWVTPQTIDMNASLEKNGHPLGPRVKLIKLCNAEYANSVLTTDRHVACLMPCTIAVYEDDAGDVFISKMNTGLMGKMFGGNIAQVMGRYVAADEKAILSKIL